MSVSKKGEAIRKKRTGELIFYCCLIAIPLLQYAIMYVAVNLNSIVLAFKSYGVNQDGTATVQWVGLVNFKAFVQEFFQAEMLQRLKNSLIVYGCRLGVGTFLALLFAYYIFRSFKGSQFFRYMLMLPSFISPVVLVMIFTYVVEYAIPAIFSVRSLFDGPPIQQLFVVILYNTLVGFGSGVLMYSNAMARIPVSLTEYGKLEGISPIREFFTVVLPCIYPTLETFLIIGVSQIFIDQANLYTFFGGSTHFSIQTIGYWLYTQVLDGRATMSSYPYISAAGLVLSAITIPVVMIARKFLDKLDKEVEF
ncbi:MAG: sugar ABC transporter permease [Firmicutes bacterium]|jgi:ABC-type sugar transport system permease subunit|nr:sugar ABC transporter permease [Bacillota bacterium]